MIEILLFILVTSLLVMSGSIIVNARRRTVIELRVRENLAQR